MEKVFSVASWNVKQFSKGKNDVNIDRVKRVLEYLHSHDPDVFAIYEVTGKDLWREIMREFPGYVFEITEGPQTQEILVGIREGITCFMTQRTEFNSGITKMRPGLLATVLDDNIEYCLLFLHLASKQEPRGFGLRDAMIEKAFKLREKLNENAEDKQARYIILGDLNTMGMEYPFDQGISSEHELQYWDEIAEEEWGMVRLPKTHDKTWRNLRGKRSNLDHVYATKNLSFKEFDKNGVKGYVDVRGWVDEDTKKKEKQWVKDHSDHSVLYFEVQKPSA